MIKKHYRLSDYQIITNIQDSLCQNFHENPHVKQQLKVFCTSQRHILPRHKGLPQGSQPKPGESSPESDSSWICCHQHEQILEQIGHRDCRDCNHALFIECKSQQRIESKSALRVQRLSKQASLFPSKPQLSCPRSTSCFNPSDCAHRSICRRDTRLKQRVLR